MKFLLALAICTLSCSIAVDKPIITTRTIPDGNALKCVLLGAPLTSYRDAAQTINTLKVFNNKLYIGYGDWTVNTGPTDVIYYDFAKKEFIKEFTVQEEAITNYRVIDNKLAITGTDSTESWDFGNIYVLTETGWVKHRSVTNGIHVFDIASFNGKWYTATGNHLVDKDGKETAPGAILSSPDEGKTWNYEYITQLQSNLVTRINALMPFDGRLYAFSWSQSSQGMVADHNKGLDAIVYNGRSWVWADLIPANRMILINPFIFKNRLILFACSVRNDGAGAAKTLYSYNGTGPAEIVPVKCRTIGDVLAKEDKLFLLVIDENNRIAIAETNDLANWTYHLLPFEIRQLSERNIFEFGLKLEYGNGHFYIGTSDGRIFETE